MAEKFHYMNNRDTEAGWALISVLSILSAQTRKKIERDADGNYDIHLTVNGVECSFAHIIKRLNGDFDHRVKVQAARMINTLFSREFMAMTEVLDQAKQKLRILCGIPDEMDPQNDLMTVDELLKMSDLSVFDEPATNTE